jgi:hypothetical protein
MIESTTRESLPETPIRPFGPEIAAAMREPALPLQQELNTTNSINQERIPTPENLHNTKNTTNVSDDEAPAEKNLGLYIRKNYPTWFNWTTIILHSLGAMLPFVSLVPKQISAKIKESAIWFSRWGVPIVKIHTGLEALKGRRLFEAAARVLPTLFLRRLPFFNFQLAYGLSSGVNVVLEHMGKKTGELLAEDGFKVNNQKVIDGFKSMMKDLVQGVHIKERTELTVTLLGAAGMISGSILALLFARDSLNSTLAKVFGSIRSVGGLLGDLSIIFFSSKTDPAERRKEKLVGSFYLIPSMMDFIQRWISQSSDANEIFNHAKTTLNTVAEVLWSSMSTDRNARQEEKQDTKIAPIVKTETPRKANVDLHLAV